MKTTAVLPKLAARDMRAQWEDAGRPTINDRALAEARRILAQPNEAVWDGELDAKIRAAFRRPRRRRRDTAGGLTRRTETEVNHA